MDWQPLIKAIVNRVTPERSIEGVFISGSVVNRHQDAFSDLDLGIASVDTLGAFQSAYMLRLALTQIVGQPIRLIERGWSHCKMVAALYGKSQFPPVGLEVDFIFSQLRHVSEQMPYAPYQVVFDRSGKLEHHLSQQIVSRPRHDIEQELLQQTSAHLYYVHDALKAWHRGDMFHFQSLLDEIRKQVFMAAALEAGDTISGSKRGHLYLSAEERKVFEKSYQQPTSQTVAALSGICLQRVAALQTRYRIDVDALRNGLAAIM